MAATVERATPDDARQAAGLAARKRAEYEAYSPVFWRVAADASLVTREGGRLSGILIANHRVGPPPLKSDNGAVEVVGPQPARRGGRSSAALALKLSPV